MAWLERMFDAMSWIESLPDEIDQGLDRFAGLQSADLSQVCELMQAADVSQHWMGDGARTFPEWVSARLRLRLETARVLVVEHGGLVPNQTARRLVCDSAVQTVIHDGPKVIGIGRRSRIVPGWLRRQVYHRDGSRCRFPGCGNTRWLQVHHRHHWAQGGPTDSGGFHHRMNLRFAKRTGVQFLCHERQS